jgi:hypothetical protein
MFCNLIFKGYGQLDMHSQPMRTDQGDQRQAKLFSKQTLGLNRFQFPLGQDQFSQTISKFIK